MNDLPGLDLDLLSRWLDTACPGLRHGPLTGAVIAGGKSNLTYRVSDSNTVWAVRRPPLGHVLPTAHDMAREFRVLSALAPTKVPVPRPVAICTDPAVQGVTFYLMDFVDGAVLDKQPLLDAVDATTARQLGTELIDTLVRLHDVDPGQVGLSDFGRPEGFLARQVARWHTQWQASETRPLPLEAEVAEQLMAQLPDSGPPAIVHGDYRLTNVIYSSSLSGIDAIVDWEMATLGDPLADLGLLHVYHQLAMTSDMVMPLMAPARGFLTADELAARYAERSGRDLSRLGWYVAFGYFKLAVISEGIAARFLQGKTVGEGFGDFAAAVPELLGSARAALNSD